MDRKKPFEIRTRSGRRPWLRSLLLSFLAVTGLGISGVWAQEASQEPDRVPVSQDRGAAPEPQPISLQIPLAFQVGRDLHKLDAVTPEQIAVADQDFAAQFADVVPAPPRVGLSRPVGPLALAAAGQQNVMANGESVWTMAVQSPGALGLRVHFSKFDVGAGTVLVYGRDGNNDVITRGPYTDKGPDDSGEFWTPTVPGETVFIEVTGAEAPQVEVDEIGHLDNDPALVAGPNGMPGAPGPGSCELDVMCYGNPPVHPWARDAVARLLFQVQPMGGWGLCTGTILNDNDDATLVPYMLTAYHCISTQFQASSVEAVYFWQRASCGGALPNFNTLPRSNGGQLLVSNPTSGGNDMSFIRLRGDLPGGVTLAGWTTAALPNQVNGIHHPGGDWKRVDFGRPNSGGAHCGGLPDNQYHYIRVDSGITEGGSSGSALFDNGVHVLGQLYGVCHFGDVLCNNRDTWNDVYGRFDVTYPLIRRWLDIGGTVNVNRFYGGIESGTPAQPYRTVNGANGLINSTNWDGGRIKIQAGSYNETMTLSHKMTLIANGGTVKIGAP